jgi:thermitase
MAVSSTLRLGLAAATVLSSALAGCGRAPLATAPGNARGMMGASAVRQGELVVKFKAPAARQAVLQKLGLRSLARVERLDAVVVKAADPGAALAALKADPNVAYAEPNYVMRVPTQRLGGVVPRFRVSGGDELLPQLYGMKNIEAQAAWGVTRGKGVKIAVVDTGIDYRHKDLADRVIDKGRDFASGNDDGMDDHFHGTHCAGSAAASMGNGGVVGVAPEASLIAVKVLGADGSGSYAGVANGIIYAADAGAHILSMSLGGSRSSQVVEDAVKYAQGKGVLVVAAMGNDGHEAPSYPAACAGVLAVGAVDRDDRLPNFTNFGAHISVTAPGVDILSTTLDNGYEELSGTSMATPHVSGLAALVKAANPAFTAQQIRQKLESSADDKGLAGFDKYFGHGRINAAKALR